MRIYVIESKDSAQAESKARVAYARIMRRGVPEGGNQPPLSSLPNEPAVIVPAGLESRINLNNRRIKAHPFCNEAIREQLQINASEPVKANAADAQPSFKAQPAVGSHVALDWTKGKFDGVVIESQREDETAWTFLDKDFKSPFTDTRPPLVAGRSERRRYRLIYLLNDVIVGIYSVIVEVNTIP